MPTVLPEVQGPIQKRVVTMPRHVYNFLSCNVLLLMYLFSCTHSNLFYRHVIGTVKGVVLVVLLVILLVEEFKSIYVD